MCSWVIVFVPFKYSQSRYAHPSTRDILDVTCYRGVTFLQCIGFWEMGGAVACSLARLFEFLVLVFVAFSSRCYPICTYLPSSPYVIAFYYALVKFVY